MGCPADSALLVAAPPQLVAGLCDVCAWKPCISANGNRHQQGTGTRALAPALALALALAEAQRNTEPVPCEPHTKC